MSSKKQQLVLSSISKENLESFPRILEDNYEDSFIHVVLPRILFAELSLDERYWALKAFMKYRHMEGRDLCYLTRCPTLLKRFLKEEYCDSDVILDCMSFSIEDWNLDCFEFLLQLDIELDNHKVIKLINEAISTNSWSCLRILLKKFDLDLEKYTIVLHSCIPLDVLKLLVKYGIDLHLHVNELNGRFFHSVEVIQFLENQGIVMDFDKITKYNYNDHSFIVFAFKRGATITKKVISYIDNKETLIFLAKNGIEREMFTSEQLQVLEGLETNPFF